MKNKEKVLYTFLVAVVYFIVLVAVFFIGFKYNLHHSVIEASKGAIIVGLVVYFIDYLSKSGKDKRRKKRKKK